jgi:hypothetical protein
MASDVGWVSASDTFCAYFVTWYHPLLHSDLRIYVSLLLRLFKGSHFSWGMSVKPAEPDARLAASMSTSLPMMMLAASLAVLVVHGLD